MLYTSHNIILKIKKGARISTIRNERGMHSEVMHYNALSKQATMREGTTLK